MKVGSRQLCYFGITDVRKASNRGLKVKVSTFHKWSYSFLRSHGVFNEYAQMERSEHNEILSHAIAETRKSFQTHVFYYLESYSTQL